MPKMNDRVRATSARRLATTIAALLALAATLAACGGGGGGGSNGGATSAGTSAASTPTTSDAATTTATTAAAAETFNPDDWPVFGRDRDNTRFAPQTQINARTISRLGEAWSNDLGGDQYLQESFPIVVDGVIYVTTSTDEVYAFDGATGAVKWKYAPKVDFSLSSGVGGYGISVNRGVAVADGKVYLLTFDCQLKAISAATGEEVFSTQVDDPRSGAYETMSPTVYDGQVYVGNSGSDQGVRGFVASYDAKTGKQRWRFYTIPPVGTGWRTKGTGGGTVYMAPTVDTQTGRVLVGTSNPSPAIVGTKRPGTNLYTSSIIALDAKSGKLAWHHQEVAHDLWDYDAASPVVLFDTTIGGKRTRVAAEAGKSGYLFMLDANTGKDLFPRLAFVRENHTPPTTRGTLECPGPLGGSQYDPIAYSPRVNASYVSGIDFCFVLRVSNERLPGESRFGGTRSIPSDSKPTGSFSAVDMSTGKFLWRRKMPTPMGAGASVTAADLVFTIDQHGVIYAFDARTGATRWKANLGLAGAAAPVIYSVKGKQYVAVAIGGSGLTSSNDFGPIGSRVVVLTLDGKRIVRAKAPKNKKS
ncbi:MAG: Pyrrolo-quinoline quinone [Conexibacter sp.]|nr:Pyrrolo-quinoline quinone [Conexibacter sp.]